MNMQTTKLESLTRMARCFHERFGILLCSYGKDTTPVSRHLAATPNPSPPSARAYSTQWPGVISNKEGPAIAKRGAVQVWNGLKSAKPRRKRIFAFFNKAIAE